jgi:hypothetical protein
LKFGEEMTVSRAFLQHTKKSLMQAGKKISSLKNVEKFLIKGS